MEDPTALSLHEKDKELIKSQVLQRVYEKAAKLKEQHRQQPEESSNVDQNEDPKKVSVSSEWKQALDRLIKSMPETIHQQHVKRNETLQFFVKTSWPSPRLPSKGKKHSKKIDKQRNKFNILDYDNVNLEEGALKSSVVDYDQLIQSKNKQILCAHQFKDLSARLEGDELEQDEMEELLDSHVQVERFLLKMDASEDQSPWIIKSNFFNSKFFLRQVNRLMKEPIDLIGKPQNIFGLENNAQFVLTFYLKAIEFIKHPSMSSEDECIKSMVSLHRQYTKLTSNETCNQLTTLDKIIDDLLVQFDNETKLRDSKIKVQLLNEFANERFHIITKRRETLTSLLEVWHKYKNKYQRSSKAKSNKTKLTFSQTEIENVREEEELYKAIVVKRMKIAKLIDSDKSEEEIETCTFLDDGRKPGETKYSQIELKIKEKQTNKSSSSETLIKVEVSNAKKRTTFFESKALNANYHLIWNQARAMSISFEDENSVQSNSIEYHTITHVADKARDDPQDRQVLRQFPQVSIYETSKGSNSSRECLLQCQLDELPDFAIRNANNMKTYEKEFTTLDKETSNVATRGTLTFGLFWSNVAPDVVDTQSKYYKCIDRERYKIERLRSIAEVEHKLYQIRYSPETTFPRRLQLLDMLFRKKYALEIEQLQFRVKKEKPSAETSTSSVNTIFADKSTITSNKRFQLMINRHNGVDNFKTYKFIPIDEKNIVIEEMHKSREKQLFDELNRLIVDTCAQQAILIGHKQDTETGQGGTRKGKHNKRRSSHGRDTADSVIDQPEMLEVNQHWCLNHRHPLQYLAAAEKTLLAIISNNYENNEEIKNITTKTITSLDDIVIEPKIDPLAPTTFSLFSINPTKRKLNPDRRKATISMEDALQRETIQVVLNLQHALGLPFRTSGDDDDRQTTSTMVEIVYDNQEPPIYSSTESGSQPNWNETFKFNIRLNPNRSIYLNLFEVQDDQGFDEGKGKDHLDMEGDRQQTTKRWLGRLELPLNLLFYNSKIEGIFPLDNIYYLNGYRNVPYNLNSNTEEEAYTKNSRHPNTADKVHSKGKLSKTVEQTRNISKSLLGSLPSIALAIFLTTDPQIEYSVHRQGKQEGTLETTELYEHCIKWTNSYWKSFPKRICHSMVQNLQRKSLLVTRLLSRVKPPELNELIDLDDLVAQSKGGATKSASRTKNILNKLLHNESFYVNLLIRYVSLVPTLRHPDQTCVAKDELLVCLDCLQFLSLRVGSQLDHAICLCCYLLYLGKRAFLALGTSSCHGPVTYVIMYPSNDLAVDANNEARPEVQPLLIDAQTGERYKPNDYYLQLNSIDCIVTETNVYANIQKNNAPSQTNFNLRKTNCWRPLFGEKEVARFAINNSIQLNTFGYGELIEADMLAGRIENYIREKFMNWRRAHANTFTAFNRSYHHVVRQFLPLLEQHACFKGQKYFSNQQMSIEERILSHMEEIDSVHNVVDHAIHLRRIDLEAIGQLVHSTALHTHGDGDSNVEFILACHVHVYPANVFSIWIYLAALYLKLPN